MAVKNNNGATKHYWLRVSGMTGLLIGAAGLALWLAMANLIIGLPVFLIGATLVVLALVSELKGIQKGLSSRRGAMGSNVGLQLAFAVALLVLVNLFSYGNYARLDLTRDGTFTIDYEGDTQLGLQLGRLKDETRIVLHLTHTTFGQGSDKLDNYDAAAEQKVMAKVKDLVEQFQELGPRFEVTTLDVQERDYQKKLNKLTEGAKELRKAIDESNENSIFFYSKGDVQRLSFSDVYQLDKKASKEANNKRGNLVLHYQGEGAFARRILSLGGKQPRIGVAVIHQALGMQGASKIFSMATARKSLQTRGFNVKDIILKKWDDFGGPKATVRTHDEYEYEALEQEINELEFEIKQLKDSIAYLEKDCKKWEESTLAQLNMEFAAIRVATPFVDPTGRRIYNHELLPRDKAPLVKKQIAKSGRTDVKVVDLDEELRKMFLEPDKARLAREKVILEPHELQLAERSKEKNAIDIEDLSELRRITDLKAKMDRLLEDVDLLILPRVTLRNVASESPFIAPNSVHLLEQAQFDAIKRFIASGKPVLFCLGPENTPIEFQFRMKSGPDKVKGMLEELGFKLPAQTVLFDVESKEFARRRAGVILLGSTVEPPTVDFDWKYGTGSLKKTVATQEYGNWRHPIHTSLRLAARSVGDKEALNLRLRHPRPVYFKPDEQTKRKQSAVFLMSSPDSWNESDPFPKQDYSPRYDLPGSKEKKKKPGPLGLDQDGEKEGIEKERRGPFPIGAAIETKVPAGWNGDGKNTRVRVGVIGHGGVFMGETLSPVQEKLMLDVSNWLLGRDDLLAKESEDLTWSYPRVDLSATQLKLWQWGSFLGMPLFFVWLGGIVVLGRWLR